MNTKARALALLSVIVVAVIAGSFIFAMQAVKADTTTPVATNSEAALTSVNATDNVLNGFTMFGDGRMMVGMEPRFAMGHRGLVRGFVGLSAVQVSSDFTANVTNIAKNDSDVQNLLNQGYNITSIRPVISTVVDGNGNVVTKASTANVLLLGNNGSKSFVAVDLAQDKVTKIVTLTTTEIDK